MVDRNQSVFPWGTVRWSPEAETFVKGISGFDRKGERSEELEKMMSSMTEPEKWKPAVETRADRMADDVVRLLARPQIPCKSEEWHAKRRKVFTASDAPLAMGVVKGKNLASVIAKKHGPAENKVWQQACQWGNQYESQALALFQLFSGQEYASTNCGLFVHEVEEHVAATPDAVLRKGGLVEVKCPFSYKNNSLLNTCSLAEEDLPKKYWWQVQQQLYVTLMKHCLLLQYRPFTPTQKACLTISLITFAPSSFLPLLYMYKNHASLITSPPPPILSMREQQGHDFLVVDTSLNPPRKNRKKKKRKTRAEHTEQELHEMMNFL